MLSPAPMAGTPIIYYIILRYNTSLSLYIYIYIYIYTQYYIYIYTYIQDSFTFVPLSPGFSDVHRTPSDAEMDASKQVTDIIRNPIPANSRGRQEQLHTLTVPGLAQFTGWRSFGSGTFARSLCSRRVPASAVEAMDTWTQAETQRGVGYC